MGYQNIFKRYEVKYLLTKEQQQILLKIMRDYMHHDKFGKNTISNIYFDTPDKLLIRRSIEKPDYKEKLRVRSYGIANAYSTVFVEIKKKYKGVVYKRRMDMLEHTASNYLCEHIPLENPTQISKEIDYFMKLYQNIEPAVFLSYSREAFFSKTDSNFRITFDENILYRDDDLSLTSSIYGEPILPQGMVLMEVKTSLGMPIWLLNFLSQNKIYKTSFSKYGNAYKYSMLPKFLGGIKNVA
ncbi:polyphosphate polymerase domain-containing protein [Marinisporobacter balticus]|uniref:VTC domain-containing protein n=1 Tax=Marinisporobacter balticus TaxID=2018667 RepID=A0A4R2KIK6_9FIRM|nr:polyphosphate polymerase domain-containing protein [Marinisporobacter balticus]TCO70389.1 VTC domain-containing protein [Marinisporobacter balticus]